MAVGTRQDAYVGSPWGLYASDSTGKPAGAVTTTVRTLTRGPTALAANTWVHLAVTDDGTTLRLYVADVQVASTPAAGAISVSPGAMRIGGNDVFGEWFQGLVDEVHVYNRALTPAEVTADSTFRV